MEVFDRIGVNACPSTDSVFFRCNIQFLFLILLYSLKNTKNGDKNDDDFVVSLSAEKKVAFGRGGEQKQQKQRQR